eukprot:scaffold1312_cov393-Prasinococcus_capsulatus_cf.AAC.10
MNKHDQDALATHQDSENCCCKRHEVGASEEFPQERRCCGNNVLPLRDAFACCPQTARNTLKLGPGKTRTDSGKYVRLKVPAARLVVFLLQERTTGITYLCQIVLGPTPALLVLKKLLPSSSKVDRLSPSGSNGAFGFTFCRGTASPEPVSLPGGLAVPVPVLQYALVPQRAERSLQHLLDQQPGLVAKRARHLWVGPARPGGMQCHSNHQDALRVMCGAPRSLMYATPTPCFSARASPPSQDRRRQRAVVVMWSYY